MLIETEISLTFSGIKHITYALFVNNDIQLIELDFDDENNNHLMNFIG